MVVDRGDGEEVVVPMRYQLGLRVESGIMNMFACQNHVAMNKINIAYWEGLMNGPDTRYGQAGYQGVGCTCKA